MAATKYTVKWGDTLSELAVTYNTTVANLVKWNDITDPDFIVVGQVLYVTAPDSSEAVSTTNNTSTAKIKAFGLQSGTDRTVYATWSWSKSNTDHYEVIWYYYTGDNVAFIGSDTTVDVKQSIYNAPSNATKVKFKVKPVSETKTVNKKETYYWTSKWSTTGYYYFSENPPETPPVPDVKIDNYKLTASLDNLDPSYADTITFQIVINNSRTFKTGESKIKTGRAAFACTVDAGANYKVRCRAVKDEMNRSDWSEYSENYSTIPAAPTGWKTIKALTETSVYLDWENVKTATSYEIQYTTQKRYFDSSNEVQSMTVDATVGHAEVTGLESGQEYFFRVRAVNEQGNSAWTEIKSIIIGKKPSAPTTWSSATTVITGDELILYWVHNSEDGSSQTYAQLQLTIGGNTETITIQNTTDEDLVDKTSSYTLDTSSYDVGTTIKWRVRTAGILESSSGDPSYGDWSTQRTITVYAPAVLSFNVTNSAGTDLGDTITSYPFYIKMNAGPNTQKPIGYHVSIAAYGAYNGYDEYGNPRRVSKREVLYSKYFDTSTNPLSVEILPSDVVLDNNWRYTITCTVAMNSGLSATESLRVTTSWADVEYEPNAEIFYSPDTLTVNLMPYCTDENDTLISDVTLSVYRREFDGSFTVLIKDLENNGSTFVPDPHPALDYARYRIIAKSKTTGSISYYDLPGYPIGETAVIIQWNETWDTFDVTSEDELEDPPWSGSMLRLPYNIDVSDANDPDVSHIEYIGRTNPVAYYGTQIGSTSTWNVDVPKDDEETLYTLRRLAAWMGDVYVREPSGSGYWASIKVSFSRKHVELVVPVTLDITRVEGGA